MPRRYRRYRSRRALKTVKYSNETTVASINLQIAPNAIANGAEAVVLGAAAQGMRKVKNITLEIQAHPDAAAIADINAQLVDRFIYWALVYVPQGQNPGNMNLPAGNPRSFYDPNQNVIMSGVMDLVDPQRYKIRSRLARNLNSGDEVGLLCALDAGPGANGGGQVFITALTNYAICYN